MMMFLAALGLLFIAPFEAGGKAARDEAPTAAPDVTVTMPWQNPNTWEVDTYSLPSNIPMPEKEDFTKWLEKLGDQAKYDSGRRKRKKEFGF